MKESKILLVDDDEFVLSRMAAMLKSEGYKVATAKSGDKAVKLLEKNNFDLVITDLVMGKVNGFMVAEKARELYPETATMILTGYKTTDFAIDALRIGVDDYLIKPSETDDILFSVRRCLEKSKANKERRQAEEALRESEEHLRLVLQSIPSFVAESDLNGKVLSLNKVQPGFSLEDFVGKSILDTTHPKGRETRKKSFDDIIEKGISVEYEAEDYGPNKSKAYYHFNLSPVLKDGEIKSVILVVSDITERKQAEQEQHFLLSAIEQSSEGIATVDLNGNFLFVNKAMAAMHGYTQEELTGRNLSIFHTPEQMAAVTRANKQTQETGEFTGEIGHVRKDGNLFLGIMKNSIIRDEEGNSIGITGTLRDITEQKRYENLIQSLRYLGISLSAESRLDEGLRLSLEAAISISVMDCGGIYLVDAASGALDLAFQKGLTPDFIDNVSHYDSKSVSARLVMAGKPIYSSHQETGIPLTEEKKLEGLKALAIIPILHESHVIGCMNVASHTHEEVPVFSRKALELITTQIGSAIARLKSEETLRGSKARLAESNQLLAGVLEHTHMMAVFLDPQFNFIWVNCAYADTCRHEPSFFPGKNHFVLYPHEENQAIFQRVLETSEPFFVEAKPFEFPDQPERGMTYWDWSLIPVKDSTGKVAGLVFTLAEVTDRKRMEDVLRESEKKFRELFNNANDAIFLWEWTKHDTIGRCIEVNDVACQTYGYSRDEFLKITPDDLTDIESVQQISRTIKKLSVDRHATFEVIDVAKDGLRIPVEISSHLFDLGGKTVLLSIVRDIADRKKANEMQRLQSEIAANMSEGIYLIRTSDMVIAYTNSKFTEMFGYGPDEMVGQHVSIVNAPTDLTAKETVKAIMSEIEKGGGYWQGEVKNIKKDGNPFWCHAGVSVFDHPEYGEILVSVHTDITERKKAEEALRKHQDHLEELVEERTAELTTANQKLQQEIIERKRVEEILRKSEENYRILVDNTPDFIYSFDRESRHTAVNQSICKALGLNAQDIISKNLTDLGFPDDIVQEWKSMHQTVFTSKELVKAETTTPMSDGILHTYEVVLMPICDERSTVTGIRGISRDITERKQAEEALKKHQDHLEELVEERTAELTTANQKLQQEIIERRQAEESLQERERHLQSVFKTMVEGVLLIAPDGDIVEANSAAEHILGLSRSKIQGRSHVSPQWEVLRPDGTPMQAEEMAGFRAMKEKRPVKDVVGGVKRPNGEVSWINTNAAPLMNKLGNLESVVATFTDITERKKAEEQIKDALKEKEVLLQEIHHRVKNNMQVIASLLNLQKHRIKDEEYRAAFEESRNRVHSMALVHELLYQAESLSNIELDGYIENLANRLIRAQRGMVKITFTRDVQDISLGIDQAVPCGLVLNELITNALTHAFSGRRSGKIEIKARQLDEEIELILSDNGRGIPKDIDYRNTETLGLQLVFSIVEKQLKGTWEMSRERGTKHTIRFRAK